MYNEYNTLNSHPRTGRNPKQYGKNLAISTQYIHPSQLRGIIELSDAQSDMVWELNSRHGRDWIARLFDESGDEGLDARVLRTWLVLRRKIGRALNIGRGETFTLEDGNTVQNIVDAIARGEMRSVVHRRCGILSFFVQDGGSTAQSQPDLTLLYMIQYGAVLARVFQHDFEVVYATDNIKRSV